MVGRLSIDLLIDGFGDDTSSELLCTVDPGPESARTLGLVKVRLVVLGWADLGILLAADSHYHPQCYATNFSEFILVDPEERPLGKALPKGRSSSFIGVRHVRLLSRVDC